MTLNEFQGACSRTHDAPFPERERLFVMALGLCGEAGEVADLVKKHAWHGRSREDFRSVLAEELGDVLWYVADLCTSCGLDLEDVAAGNVEKIARRYPEGFRVGGGIR